MMAVRTGKKKTLLVVLIILGAFIAVFFAYVGTYSGALPPAAEIAAGMAEDAEGNLCLFAGGDTGFIIYPGGKVDERAYAPLAQLLYENGHTVVIAKMPFHLSIFDSGKGLDIMEQNPQVGRWVIVGHSLGGTSASMFAAEHPDRIAGVVFLASYPYKDLSGCDFWTLTIDGSNDRVLDREKAAQYEGNYPERSFREEIDGGNHAGFGNYGAQQGDGDAGITWEEQTEITARLILNAAAIND